MPRVRMTVGYSRLRSSVIRVLMTRGFSAGRFAASGSTERREYPVHPKANTPRGSKIRRIIAGMLDRSLRGKHRVLTKRSPLFIHERSDGGSAAPMQRSFPANRSSAVDYEVRQCLSQRRQTLGGNTRALEP